MSEAIIQPRAIVAALDEVIGWLYDMEPRSSTLMEADCPDLFPVLHAEFSGQITCRDDFPYFEAWLIPHGDKALAERIALLRGPIIETLH